MWEDPVRFCVAFWSKCLVASVCGCMKDAVVLSLSDPLFALGNIQVFITYASLCAMSPNDPMSLRSYVLVRMFTCRPYIILSLTHFVQALMLLSCDVINCCWSLQATRATASAALTSTSVSWTMAAARWRRAYSAPTPWGRECVDTALRVRTIACTRTTGRCPYYAFACVIFIWEENMPYCSEVYSRCSEGGGSGK